MVVEKFEKFYQDLSSEDKSLLLKHILNSKIMNLNEGYYSGPSGTITKGLFTGPSNSQRVCSTCKRPL